MEKRKALLLHFSMLYHNFSLVFPGRIGYNVLENNGWKNGKEEPDMMRQMFSLIELLITVAVIAILAGLLLPALNSARQKGQAIRCVSNLKQQGNCHSLYAADFDDWIISQEGVFGGYKCTWWRMFRLLGYTGESLKNFQALRNDAAQESIFCCPSGSFRTEWAPFDLWSYGLNGHLAGVEGSGSRFPAECGELFRAVPGSLRRSSEDAQKGFGCASGSGCHISVFRLLGQSECRSVPEDERFSISSLHSSFGQTDQFSVCGSACRCRAGPFFC